MLAIITKSVRFTTIIDHCLPYWFDAFLTRIILDMNLNENYGSLISRLKKYFSMKPIQVLQIDILIKPLYLLMTLFGLFPYSIKYHSPKRNFVIAKKSIYVNSLCGISVLLLIAIFLALHIQDVLMSSEKVSMTEVLMTQSNYILELINFAIFTFAAYVCAFVNRGNYVDMLNTVTSAWFDLPITLSSQRILSRLRFQINITISILVLVFIMQIGINFTRHDSFWKMMLVAITFNLPQMIQFITLAYYNSLVMIVIALLTNINEQCQELVKDKNANGSLNVKLRNAGVTIKLIESVYVKAFEVKTFINNAFQGPILASSLQCFHSIVSESHIIYHGAVNSTLSTHDVFNCSIWIVYQVTKIYLLAYSGNLLKVKASKIGQTLHCIPTEKKDLRWLMEVQHFSTLMNYQEIGISVYGYFPVDDTLIFNVLTSATMYLIILVQFDRK